MTEIPKEARAKAHTLMALWPHVAPESVVDNVARYIADVSEKAKEASLFASKGSDEQVAATVPSLLAQFILPEPEDPQVKEAREICARDSESVGSPISAAAYRSGDYDKYETMRCTLAALRKGN